MSDGINMMIGGQRNDGFTVKSIAGCRIVFGSIPISEFGMLTHGFSKRALIAPDIADRIGASFVIGEPSDLENLRNMELPVSEKRHADYLAATNLGLHRVAMWLRTGERGSSSNAMCKRIFGVPESAGIDHPHDPDDLRRCLLFIDATQAHDKVPLMADVSPAWHGLAAKWVQITDCFREEIAGGKLAPKTYVLMQEAIN